MKNRFFLSSVVCIVIMLQPAYTQSVDNKSITGSWMGKISTGAIDLRIIFNISVVGKDSVIATLDSPDQGATNIKLGTVNYTGETLRIVAPMMMAEYNGTVKNDTLIEGTWKQGGASFPLNIVKRTTSFTLNRPQEPNPPFPYISEDVTFYNDKFDINLAGTLTIPRGEGPFPAVILISGSGPQNRNEELMGHKPFLVIADYLTRNNIAVFRYDDRGVGKSQGDYIKSTSADLATDAEAAFNYLKSNSKIDPTRIGLIGHSEGGLIAPITVASNSGVAFIISLAGPGVTGEEILIRQGADISRVSGLDEKTIEKNIATNKKLFAVLKKEKDNKLAGEKMIAEYRKILKKQKSSPEDTENAVKAIEASLTGPSMPWLRYFIITDPQDFWKKVKCPVLALNGEKDLQVAADENLPAIEKSVKSGGNNNVKTIKFAGLNHIFQHCETGLPTEYREIEETFSPEVLMTMSDWIRDLK